MAFGLAMLTILGGCAPTVTVNGETFEVLTPREEKDLILIARAALKRSKKAATSSELQIIQNTAPEFKIDYYGDRSGDAKVTWDLPERRLTVQFRGQLLTDHMVAQMYTVKRYDGVLDFSKGEPTLRRDISPQRMDSDPGAASLEDLLKSPAR